MKLTRELTIVICVMILGGVGLILGLAVLADWSDGAILAMFSLFASIATGLIATVRNQQKNAETLDLLQRQVGTGQRVQSAQLDQVVKQTNGPSHADRIALARETAAATVAEMTGQTK